MEKPILNINVAHSFFTVGSAEPVTTEGHPSTGACSNEMPFLFGQDFKFICIGMLKYIGPFPHYGPCQFDKDKCPFNMYRHDNNHQAEQLNLVQMLCQLNNSQK